MQNFTLPEKIHSLCLPYVIPVAEVSARVLVADSSDFTLPYSVVSHVGSLSDDDNNPTNKLTACRKCNMTFNSIPEKRKHQRVVHMKKPVECPRCGMMISSKGNLKRHIEEHHNKKKIKCDMCGKRYSRLDYHPCYGE